LNNFKTEPNATENCENKKKILKKNFDRSLFQKLRKKRKKNASPKKQDSARQSIIIKTT